MNLTTLLPTLLATAWLLPLASFVLILFFGKRMGHGGKGAGYLATGAIVSGFVLSLSALICWLRAYPLAVPQTPGPVSGDWYTLGQFGSLSLTVGYYIDSLTIAMFCMVTLIASCIHVYSLGYMHEELHDVTDRLALLENGEPLVRRGRFYRFFQFLSLFCFSMLGLVIAGNLAMVFAFWELVGICSYLLIGFYIERKSASNAANKAFIVNRVGDFGMIIGLMAIFAGHGHAQLRRLHSKGDKQGHHCQVRPAVNVIELDWRRHWLPGFSGIRPRSNTLPGCPTTVPLRRRCRTHGPDRSTLSGTESQAESSNRQAAVQAWKRISDLAEPRSTATGSSSLPGWASSADAWARAPSSRCTSGCPTPWKAPRPSAP